MSEKYEFIVKRVGECKACGACCPAHCPHLTEDNKCAIYEHRDEWCETCGTAHTICVKSPTFPARKWRPECGFRFLVVGKPIEVLGMNSTFNDEHLEYPIEKTNGND